MKTEKNTTKKETPIYELFSNQFQYDKDCPYCGQCLVPFKLGVCICGSQVGKIKYVSNAEKFAKIQYYSYVGTPKVEKLGIRELMDN